MTGSSGARGALPERAQLPAAPPIERIFMLVLYTTTWCGYCARLKRQLDREGIGYDEVNIEEDEAAAETVMAINGGNQTVPTVVFPDGTALTNPSLDAVKTALSAAGVRPAP
jgi:mycoredoxin